MISVVDRLSTKMFAQTRSYVTVFAQSIRRDQWSPEKERRRCGASGSGRSTLLRDCNVIRRRSDTINRRQKREDTANEEEHASLRHGRGMCDRCHGGNAGRGGGQEGLLR